jgi:hypothetical protein
MIKTDGRPTIAWGRYDHWNEEAPIVRTSDDDGTDDRTDAEIMQEVYDDA